MSQFQACVINLNFSRPTSTEADDQTKDTVKLTGFKWEPLDINSSPPEKSAASSLRTKMVLEEQVSLGGQVGQQTYYIFHPATQTFEPIIIEEFEEQNAIEEVPSHGQDSKKELPKPPLPLEETVDVEYSPKTYSKSAALDDVNTKRNIEKIKEQKGTYVQCSKYKDTYITFPFSIFFSSEKSAVSGG